MTLLARVPRVVPTRRLARLTAAGAALWLLSGSNVGWTVAATGTIAILVAAAVDAATAPRPTALTLQRLAPATIGVGDDALARYVVRSTWPAAVRLRLFHRLPDAVSARVREWSLVIPPRGDATADVVLTGQGRGRFPLGAIALRIAGPAGLTERSHRFDPGDVITVTPSIAGLRRYRLLSVQQRLHQAGVRHLRLRGTGTTFDGLRPYIVGDDPRHIDWKASAKRAAPIVREYTVEQGQTIMILVDAGRLMTQKAGAYARFEYALSSVLTLAAVAADAGDRVGLMVFAQDVLAFVPPQRGATAVGAIREALIPVQPAVVEPDYAGAFRVLAARQRRRALLVLFSDVIDRHASVALMAHTARSAGRHLPLVVAMRNQELVAAAIPASSADRRLSASHVYAAAAAEELLLGRAEALREMRRSGAVVLDVPPAAMTTAVINRYLALKARAAI